MQRNHDRLAKISDLSYEEKFSIMDREALATLILAVIIAAFFWGAILLLKDNSATFFTMPAWFVISCIGGYLLSVVGVIILVRKVMVDFPLDEKDVEEQKQDNSEKLTAEGNDERI